MGNEQSQSSSSGEKLKNNIKVSWKKTADCGFHLREGQCSCSHGNKMYLFGGVIQGHAEELVESNELLCYDAVSDTWSQIEAKGDVPMGRSAASLMAVDNRLYLFGGLSHMAGWTDSLHVFDLDTSTWQEKKSEGTKPSPRDKLQGAVVEKNIYYFGGFGPKQTGEEDDDWEDMDDDDEDDIIDEERTQQAAQFGWFNDLYVYDTVSDKWHQPMQMNLGVPTPRAAHAMCSVDRDLYIFGGRDTEKRVNDLHIFNVDTRKWKTDLECKGQPPAPRSFHTATAVGKRIVVMGGRASDNSHLADFSVYDTDTSEWLQPKVEGDIPAARGQHSAVTAGDRLVLFGGSSDFSLELMVCQKFHGDTFILNTADILKGGSLSETAADGQTNGHGRQGSSS